MSHYIVSTSDLYTSDTCDYQGPKVPGTGTSLPLVLPVVPVLGPYRTTTGTALPGTGTFRLLPVVAAQTQ
jgi:hypothetical protein